MALEDKLITELTLIDALTDDVNFGVDNGIASYRSTMAQIKAYIETYLAPKLVPPGSIQAYGAETPPSGWLVCDGSAVSRTTYATLYAIIGTSFGYGDNSTTFNLPDLRGRFLRGHADGQAMDPDRAARTAMATGGATGDNVGSVQGHAFQTHTHVQNSHGHSYTKGAVDGSGSSSTVMGANYGGTPTSYSGAITAAIATNQNAAASGTNSQTSTSETRPVNASVTFLIKI